MRRALSFLAIVGIAVALDIGLHAATADFLPLPADFEGSVLVRRFGFEMVALAWAILAFTGLGLIFLAIEPHMSGSGLGKGLRYGLALGLVVQVAMLEGVAMFGNRVIDEFVVGLSDAIPVLVMGALLGRFLASDGSPVAASDLSLRKSAFTLAIFTLIYGSGRIGSQMLGIIGSGLDSGAVPTVLWSFAMGATIGLAWLMLTDLRRGLSGRAGAMAFALGVYGINWALFMAFVPMVFPDALADTTLRVVIDIHLATGAAYWPACRMQRGIGLPIDRALWPCEIAEPRTPLPYTAPTAETRSATSSGRQNALATLQSALASRLRYPHPVRVDQDGDGGRTGTPSKSSSRVGSRGLPDPSSPRRSAR